MNSIDTIVAISSAVGAAARMIVRLSGGDAHVYARALCDDLMVGATRRSIILRGARFPAWMYVFRSPRSYTGEDLVEFHIPGNILLARWLVEHLIQLGARAAGPGEFTARAYFNSKIDLTEAEGIAATIAAQNEQELSAARQLMAGELAGRLRQPMDLLAETLGLIEVGIDFSEEDVTFLPRDQIARRIERIDASLRDLAQQSTRFERLSHEPRIVLAGRPNAGKSTLLNVLAGFDRAIVSPVAGTTRDAISERVPLKRGFVHITDVAGLEEATPAGEIERRMHERAVQAVEQADLVLLVIDVTDDRPPLPLPRRLDMVVMSKCDLLTPSPGTPGEGGGEGSSDISNLRSPITKNPHPNPLPAYRERGQGLAMSAATDQGLPLLRHRLDQLAFGGESGGSLALNARHLRAIDDARAFLTRAMEPAGGADELIAFELRGALDALGQILGVVSPDDLLGRIFSTFCIGK